MVISPIDEIAKVNKYKSQAEEAFKAKQFEKAASLYSLLADSLDVREPEILLNLAHSYFQNEEVDKAKQYYNEASVQADKYIRSVANQQLGVLSSRDKKLEEALNYFKEALKADPTNEEARFNYELLKRQKEEEEKKKEQNKQDQQNQDKEQEEKKDQQDQQNQDQKNQDQQNKDQQDQQSKEEEESKEQDQKEEQQKKEQEQQQQQEQEQQSEEQKKKEQQQMQNQRLEEIKMSKEKAEMILNALKNQELQYYQQKQRKSNKKKDSSKPDW